MIHVQPFYFADGETEALGRKEIFFKFIAELGHYTARSLQCCQFLRASGFYCKLHEGNRISFGFNLKHVVLLLTNGPSWFLGKYCLYF